jgi:hypothetical protein
MKWWIYIGCLLPLFSQANQLAIEVIDAAYPKLTLRLEQVNNVEMIEASSLLLAGHQQTAVGMSLPSNKACVAEQLAPLRGRLQVVELAWSSSIQQQLEKVKAQTWSDSALYIDIISTNESCSKQSLRLMFPSLRQFSQGWGRLSLSSQGAMEAHGFVVMQQVGEGLVFTPVSPDNNRAQQYWLNYYQQ